MKNVLLGTIAMAAMLAVPAISLADTYQYVNTSGTISSVTADTAYAALIAAPDIAPHSGVIDETTAAGITTTTAPVTITTTTNPVTTSGTTMTTGTTGTMTSGTTYETMNSLVGTYVSGMATSTMYTNSGSMSGVGQMTLVLSGNGTASLTTTYTNGTAPLDETGTWMVSGTGAVQVTLTGTGNSTYTPAHQLTFSVSGTTLTATSYPTGMYGNGLVLTEENT